MAVANDSSLLNPNNQKFGSEIRYQLKLYLQKLTEEDAYLERAIGWGPHLAFGGRIAVNWQYRLRLDKFRTEAEKFRADILKTSNLIKKILNKNNFLPGSENPDDADLVKEIINMIEAVIVVREEEQVYHRHSLFLLGYCYYKGVIARKDEDQGKILFERAIKQGYGCPVNYYLNSVNGVIGQKLDWESRYELKFYLGQLQQELYILKTKTLELSDPAIIKKDAELINKNNKLILDIEETLNWVKELLKGSEDITRNNKILKEIMARADFLLKLRDEDKQFHKHALFLQGFCFHRGIGVPQDDRKAWIYFEFSAKQGFGKAQYYLAKYYLDGFMDMPPLEAEAEAIKIFLKNLDVPEVQLYRGQCYLRGKKNKKHYDKAVETVASTETVASSASVETVLPDNVMKIGFDYLGLASSHGYAPAWSSLSPNGCGEIVQLAADQGWVPAMLSCGVWMWERNWGTLRYKPFKALYYYQMAVDHGYHFAAIEIKDRIEALEFGTNSCDVNTGFTPDVPYTPEVLGIIYYEGIGVPPNIEKAKWYIKMAREGYNRYKIINPYLAFHLSLIYGYELGAERDMLFAEEMVHQDQEALQVRNKGKNINNLYNRGVASVAHAFSTPWYYFTPNGLPSPEAAFKNFNVAYNASKKYRGVHAPDYDVVHNLRYCYETGCGVAINREKAREFYEQNIRTDFDYDYIPEEQFKLVAEEMGIPFTFRKIDSENEDDREKDRDPEDDQKNENDISDISAIDIKSKRETEAKNTTKIYSATAAGTESSATPNTSAVTIIGNTVSAAADISAISASNESWLSIHPVVKPMTPYYRQHCQAYFYLLKGDGFKSLHCAEQSVLQGNAVSVRVVNRLTPMRSILRGLDVLGEFPLPLKMMMVEYAFNDGIYLRGMKLGPFGKFGNAKLNAQARADYAKTKEPKPGQSGCVIS